MWIMWNVCEDMWCEWFKMDQICSAPADQTRWTGEEVKKIPHPLTFTFIFKKKKKVRERKIQVEMENLRRNELCQSEKKFFNVFVWISCFHHLTKTKTSTFHQDWLSVSSWYVFTMPKGMRMLWKIQRVNSVAKVWVGNFFPFSFLLF